MTTHKSIFYQAQEQVCEALNNDEVLSGKVTFIPENSKDIDYEIKNAMGRQGIVGVVMTPEATYQGITDKGEQVWDLRDFTVQVVENPIVNRGQPNYANITALDAAARASDVLAGPNGGLFGQYCPTTIEQGEDDGLIVAQCKFNVQVKAENTEPYTFVYYADGSVSKLRIEGELAFGSIPNVSNVTSIYIGNKVTSIGGTAFSGCEALTSVTIPNSVTSIGTSAFFGCSGLTSVVIPDSVMSLGNQAFDSCLNLTSATIGNGVTNIGEYAFNNCHSLSSVRFYGKTLDEVQAMANYPWGIRDTSIIHNIIGPDTRVKYGWSQSWDSLPLSGTLNSNDLPSRDGIRYIGIGSSIDEIGYRAFRGLEFLTGVEIPDTVTAIGDQAFSGAEGMTDIEIPSSVSSIGSDAFYGCHSLSSVMFDGKTIEQVQAMANYNWGLIPGCVIHCTDGDITI